MERSSFAFQYEISAEARAENEYSLPDLLPYRRTEDVALKLLGQDIGFFVPEEREETEHYLAFNRDRQAFEVPAQFLPSVNGIRIDMQDANSAFQTSLSLVQQFNDPKIFFLRQVLESQNSLLDREPYENDEEKLWLAFVSQQENLDVDPLQTCMAGFIRIIDVLDHFRTAFPVRQSEADGFAGSIPKYLAETFKWRLNLHERDTVERIDRLTEGFFGVCRETFGRHRESSILWDEKTSRGRLKLLLNDWRSRTEDNLSHINF